MAEKKKKSTAVNLTAFEILQAITGELPCHASPNGKESDKQKVQPDLPCQTHHKRRNTHYGACDLWLAKGIPGLEDLLVSSEDRMSIVGKDVRFKKPFRF